MQLECKECHRILNLPDEKLPIGTPFSFSCPYCKQKNTAMLPAPAEEQPMNYPEQPGGSWAQPPADQFPPDQPPPMPPEQYGEPPHHQPGYHEPQNEGQMADDRLSGFAAAGNPMGPAILRAPSHDDASGAIELPAPSSADEIAMVEGATTIQSLMRGNADERPKALVVFDDDDVSEMLRGKLEAIGYQATVAVNLRDAAKQLKFTDFSAVLIQEDYYGATLSGNLLLRSVQNLDNVSRRGMLVILLSPTMTTLDDLLAFSLSLDAIINTAEIDTIDRILLSIIARASKFYSVFREVLTEHGLD